MIFDNLFLERIVLYCIKIEIFLNNFEKIPRYLNFSNFSTTYKVVVIKQFANIKPLLF